MSQLLNIFEFTTNQIRTIASEQSVVDAPIVIGDITLFPVSKISCGFSCGGSDLPQKKKADGLMAGAGAKATKTPLSFLAIQNGKVAMLNVPAEDVSKFGLIDAAKPLLDTLKESFSGKKTGKAASKKSSKTETKARCKK